MANVKVLVVVALMVLLASACVLGQVEFGDGSPVGNVSEPVVPVVEKSWWGWFWDWVTSPFTKEETAEPVTLSLVLSEHNKNVTERWVEEIPQRYWEKECKWKEPTDENKSAAPYWEGCTVENGTIKENHEKVTILETWQEISDNKTTLRASKDVWCWQENSTVVMCKSTLDGDGALHIPDASNDGMTYERYEAGTNTFTASTFGNEKVLTKATNERTITTKTAQVEP